MEKCPQVPLRLKLSDFLIYKAVAGNCLYIFIFFIFYFGIILDTGAAFSGAVWNRAASCCSAN